MLRALGQDDPDRAVGPVAFDVLLVRQAVDAVALEQCLVDGAGLRLGVVRNDRVEDVVGPVAELPVLHVDPVVLGTEQERDEFVEPQQEVQRPLLVGLGFRHDEFHERLLLERLGVVERDLNAGCRRFVEVQSVRSGQGDHLR